MKVATKEPSPNEDLYVFWYDNGFGQRKMAICSDMDWIVRRRKSATYRYDNISEIYVYTVSRRFIP